MLQAQFVKITVLCLVSSPLWVSYFLRIRKNKIKKEESAELKRKETKLHTDMISLKSSIYRTINDFKELQKFYYVESEIASLRLYLSDLQKISKSSLCFDDKHSKANMLCWQFNWFLREKIKPALDALDKFLLKKFYDPITGKFLRRKPVELHVKTNQGSLIVMVSRSTYKRYLRYGIKGFRQTRSNQREIQWQAKSDDIRVIKNKDFVICQCSFSEFFMHLSNSYNNQFFIID